jgi:hypothetical protein
MNQGTIVRIPKNTNPTGARGHGGRNPTLGRPTFVDDIIARGDSSLGSIFRPSNPQRRKMKICHQQVSTQHWRILNIKQV